jgi:hypothetical protein
MIHLAFSANTCVTMILPDLSKFVQVRHLVHFGEVQKGSVATLERSMRKRRETLDGMLHERSLAVVDAGAAKQQLATVETEVGALREEAARHSRSCAALQEELAAADAELFRLQERQVELTSQLAAAQEETEVVIGEVEKSREVIQELERQLAVVRGECDSLQETEQDLHDDLDTAAAQLEKLMQNLEESEAVRMQTAEEREAALGEVEELKRAMEVQHCAVEKCKALLQQELWQALEEIEGLKGDLATLQQTATAREEEHNMQKEIAKGSLAESDGPWLSESVEAKPVGDAVDMLADVPEELKGERCISGQVNSTACGSVAGLLQLCLDANGKAGGSQLSADGNSVPAKENEPARLQGQLELQSLLHDHVRLMNASGDQSRVLEVLETVRECCGEEAAVSAWQRLEGLRDVAETGRVLAVSVRCVVDEVVAEVERLGVASLGADSTIESPYHDAASVDAFVVLRAAALQAQRKALAGEGVSSQGAEHVAEVVRDMQEAMSRGAIAVGDLEVSLQEMEASESPQRGLESGLWGFEGEGAWKWRDNAMHDISSVTSGSDKARCTKGAKYSPLRMWAKQQDGDRGAGGLDACSCRVEASGEGRAVQEQTGEGSACNVELQGSWGGEDWSEGWDSEDEWDFESVVRGEAQNFPGSLKIKELQDGSAVKRSCSEVSCNSAGRLSESRKACAASNRWESDEEEGELRDSGVDDMTCKDGLCSLRGASMGTPGDGGWSDSCESAEEDGELHGHGSTSASSSAEEGELLEIDEITHGENGPCKTDIGDLAEAAVANVDSTELMDALKVSGFPNLQGAYVCDGVCNGVCHCMGAMGASMLSAEPNTAVDGIESGTTSGRHQDATLSLCACLTCAGESSQCLEDGELGICIGGDFKHPSYDSPEHGELFEGGSERPLVAGVTVQPYASVSHKIGELEVCEGIVGVATQNPLGDSDENVEPWLCEGVSATNAQSCGSGSLEDSEAGLSDEHASAEGKASACQLQHCQSGGGSHLICCDEGSACQSLGSGELRPSEGYTCDECAEADSKSWEENPVLAGVKEIPGEGLEDGYLGTVAGTSSSPEKNGNKATCDAGTTGENDAVSDDSCSNCDSKGYEPEDESDPEYDCCGQAAQADLIASSGCESGDLTHDSKASVYAGAPQLSSEDDRKPHTESCCSARGAGCDADIHRSSPTFVVQRLPYLESSQIQCTDGSSAKLLQTLEASQSLCSPHSLKRHSSSAHQPRRAISDPVHMLVTMATGRSAFSGQKDCDEMASFSRGADAEHVDCDNAGSAYACSTAASVTAQDDISSEIRADVCEVDHIQGGMLMHDSAQCHRA